MGEAINQMFEAQQAYIYDTGVFWYSGRDVIGIFIGICIGIIFALFIQLIKEVFHENSN